MARWKGPVGPPPHAAAELGTLGANEMVPGQWEMTVDSSPNGARNRRELRGTAAWSFE